MIVFYILGFLLLCGATVILLELTPERITNDLMKFISPQQTLRDKVLIAKYGGTEVTVNGTTYVILNESDILAIID